MTTIAEIPETAEAPEEGLKSALDGITYARQLIKDRREDLNDAQKRADETKGFTAAASLEFNNAEARYLVLVNSRDYAAAEAKDQQEKHDRLADKLAAAEEELARAVVFEDWVKKAKTALNKVTGAAGRWDTRAGNAVKKLQETAQGLKTAAGKAGENRADLANAEQSVEKEHDALNNGLITLRDDLAAAKQDVQAVPEVPGLAELRRAVTKFRKDLGELDAGQKQRHATVSAADVRKAKEDRDNAQRVLEEAPDAERAAQMDLATKQAALDEALAGLSTAVAAFEAVERDYIDQIEVSEPDATGWATARALLTRAIPDGYVLRWQAGGAPMRPETGIGKTVRIDANALPVGNTVVEVTIELRP